MKNKEIGQIGESFAADYLYLQGYSILERNYKCRIGEIDIIAAKGNTISFVEVKTRRSQLMGRPSEAVNLKKRNTIRKVANYYCQQKKTDCYADFKVIEILVNQIDDAF